MEAADLEKTIVSLTNKYTTSIEELNEVELSLREAENTCFEILQTLYKQTKHSDPSVRKALDSMDKKYNESLLVVADKKSSVFVKQNDSFKILQKLRPLETKYLTGVINGLQIQLKKNNESKDNETKKEDQAKNQNKDKAKTQDQDKAKTQDQDKPKREYLGFGVVKERIDNLDN